MMMESDANFFTAYLDELTRDNTDYRRVLFTTSTAQLVLMSVPQGQTVPREIHPVTTQFIKVEKGWGELEMDNKTHLLRPGAGAVISPGTEHEIRALTESELFEKYRLQFERLPMRDALQIYVIYSPPEHPIGTRETRRLW